MFEVKRSDDGNMYITLRDGLYSHTEEKAECVFVDVDSDGRPLGIEILHSQQVPIDQLLTIMEEFGLVLSPKAVA